MYSLPHDCTGTVSYIQALPWYSVPLLDYEYGSSTVVHYLVLVAVDRNGPQTHHLRPYPLSPPPSSRPPKRRDPPTPPPDGSSFPIHKIIEPWLLTRSIAVHAVVVTTYPDIFVYIRTYGRERTGSRPASSGHRIAHATLCKQQHTRARILTAWAETRSPVVQTSPRSLERGAGSSGILRTTLSARGELAG